MDVEDLASFPLHRVAARDGLVIDAATWTDAHTYHQTAQRLHHRALHGWGIVAGLTVIPGDPTRRTVILQPGLALDNDGQLIVVPQPTRAEIPPGYQGVVCLVLRFAQAPLASGARGPATRLADSYHLELIPPPILPGDIEVARIDLATTDTPIRPSTGSARPQPGEIDARFRRQPRPAVADTVTIAQLAGAADDGLHGQGVIDMVRECGATSPFALQFLGPLPIDEAIARCAILYISGAGEFRLTPHEGARLRAFVDGGGVVLAEPCVDRETRQRENGRFVASVRRLMADLRIDLTEIGRGHPLFHARHVFGLAPDGLGGSAPILGGGNVFLNPNDYACCWQGGTEAEPLPRETIRGAMEFAANLAWYAADRAGRQASAHDGAAAPVIAGRAQQEE